MTKWLTKRNLIIALSIAIIIIIFIYIIPVSLPIIFALLTALLIDPLVRLAEDKLNWKRNLAVISVFIFIIGLLSSLFYFTVTRLIGKIIDFTKAAPEYFNTLAGLWIDVQAKLFQYTSGMPLEVVNAIQSESKVIFDSMRTSILHLLSYERIVSFATDIPNLLVSLIVYIIALFLFMLELPNLKKMLFRHLTNETAEKVRIMITRLNGVLIGFMKAQLLVSLIILAVTFVGLMLIAPKYAVIMSLIIWIIDIVPILGSIIILAPWALYHFISGDIATGTQLSILAIVLLVIRRTVEPKVMGSQIGLSPLPTLIAMFIGLKLIGFLGFFVGPLVVILFTTAREAGIIKLNFKI
ncbi:sporulation integral membrane protein YtvI [Sporosarcina sp. G11-34]|uniref:sporulation integral membrane protein YtvI n=1 Tax=Sporosarcina sp. G11-34 TaxID=2849605 RepID=UPI0022A92559|nr:sporulation integral membrane protein YtvI [Sporosarcina sp. G11-34]MCZ2258902.1 sporulation integral membrane protein YtvI [Sporosarcina sp. G11-34]